MNCPYLAARQHAGLSLPWPHYAAVATDMGVAKNEVVLHKRVQESSTDVVKHNAFISCCGLDTSC